MYIPFTLVVDDELEDSVSIRRTEYHRIGSWRASDGFESSADMGVEHRELKLQVLNVGKGFPTCSPNVVFRNVRSEYLNQLGSDIEGYNF